MRYRRLLNPILRPLPERDLHLPLRPRLARHLRPHLSPRRRSLSPLPRLSFPLPLPTISILITDSDSRHQLIRPFPARSRLLPHNHRALPLH